MTRPLFFTHEIENQKVFLSMKYASDVHKILGCLTGIYIFQICFAYWNKGIQTSYMQNNKTCKNILIWRSCH